MSVGPRLVQAAECDMGNITYVDQGGKGVEGSPTPR